jgi:cell division protein FtsB
VCFQHAASHVNKHKSVLGGSMKRIVLLGLFVFSFSALAQWSSGNIYQDVWQNTREIFQLKQAKDQLEQKNQQLQGRVEYLEQQVFDLNSRLASIEAKLNPAPLYRCQLSLRDSNSSYGNYTKTYMGEGPTEARAKASLRTTCLDERVFRPTQCNQDASCRRIR